MSLVVFPFKVEDPHVFVRNLRTAAAHPKVRLVLGVGVTEEETWQAGVEAAPGIERDTGTEVRFILQERLGALRPGKGDGMNTALRYFIENTDLPRVHFYDADITSFGPNWIEQAESAADLGFGVVRHYFPRARTDAMITWMITRSGFTLLWPRSALSWIEQPLGGELLFSREVAEALCSDDRVVRQSDWGIDTLYSFSTVQKGFPVYETYISHGKAHALYGALTDLKTMLVECFSAVQSLKDEKITANVVHRAEPSSEVPATITEKLGFDIEGTLQLLNKSWTERQLSLLDNFPTEVRAGLASNREEPRFSFMDMDTWSEVYHVLLQHFEKNDPDWEELLFKLWVVRVLAFSTTTALRGYNFSQVTLQRMIRHYRLKAAMTR